MSLPSILRESRLRGIPEIRRDDGCMVAWVALPLMGDAADIDGAIQDTIYMSRKEPVPASLPPVRLRPGFGFQVETSCFSPNLLNRAVLHIQPKQRPYDF